MGLGASIKWLYDHDLICAMSVLETHLMTGHDSAAYRERLTFFPAYRPRVMMATRPTLRTVQKVRRNNTQLIQLPLTLHIEWDCLVDKSMYSQSR